MSCLRFENGKNVADVKVLRKVMQSHIARDIKDTNRKRKYKIGNNKFYSLKGTDDALTTSKSAPGGTTTPNVSSCSGDVLCF